MDFITFLIKDTGIGLSDEQLEKLRTNLKSKEGNLGEKISKFSTGAGLGLWVSN